METENTGQTPEPSQAPAEPPKKSGPNPIFALLSRSWAHSLTWLKKLSAFNPKEMVEAAKELAISVRSSDSKTRKASYLFYMGCVGLLVGIFVWWSGKNDDASRHLSAVEEYSEEEEPVAEEKISKALLLEVGYFLIPLTPPTPDELAAKNEGVFNMAQIELTLQCDSVETCEWLKKQMPRVRDRILSAVSPLERDVLMSREGKLRFRRKIRDALNLWVPEGSVENVFVTRMWVS